MLMRALAVVFSVSIASFLQAQSCGPGGSSVPILVGSEWEQYVRSLQVSGAVPLQPWTLREFTFRQAAKLSPRDTTAPWAAATPEFARRTCIGVLSAFVLPLHAQMIENSGFPLSYNDEAVWAGRGLTVAADGGAGIVAGPISATFAPVVFSSQNANFAIKANGFTDKQRFADWRNPRAIDLPQRFGDRTYTQFDFGQSSVRLDLPLLALGVSTANQFFGPAYEHPIILGNNAAGFPHVFLGSSEPIRIWPIGAIHGRLFWGKLAESEFSSLADSGYSRLGSGITGVFQPQGIPGLEIGLTRFFHVLQRNFKLSRTEILRPFGAIFSLARGRQTGTPAGDEPDNQLSSVFARFVLPNSGLEVYGEFGREDRNFDLREFFYFLDHESAYLLGLHKVWKRDGTERMRSFRAEVLNSRVTHLALSSHQSPWYIHGRVPEGHTNRGQALGSAAGYGGGASMLALEQYDRRGYWRLEWQRMQFADARDVSQVPDLFRSDVAHMVEASALRFGRRADVELGVTGVYEFNRYLEKDAASVRLMLSVRQASKRKQ
jgi:hypothetical protein